MVKRSKDAEKTILRAVRIGLSRERAAELAGIHRTTLFRWMDADESFATAVKQAQAAGVESMVAKLCEQALGGSVPALTYWLTRRASEFREPKEQPLIVQLPDGTSVDDLGAVALSVLRAGMAQGASPSAIKSIAESIEKIASARDKTEIAAELRQLSARLDEAEQ